MHVQAVFIPFIFVRMEEKGKILIIDDNKDVLFALNLLLEPYMQKVKVTTQPARIEYFMRTFQPDVVLLDMNFHRDAVSGQEGFETNLGDRSASGRDLHDGLFGYRESGQGH